ncbi:MAG: tRNA 2-thiouridine(34) synthase MnmA [Oscillospiraceae bacterium]|nr:tRNA 2-thiouridine(34) synthase MnmA [Oscillospiraceae bacterium]
MKEKIVLGLSGGVDSAVAAALLRRDYEVHCLFLDAGSGTGREDARATACFLHLPFAVSSIREPLEECVCTPFAADYVNGKTPLPCARCNPLVKFPALMREADRIGARLVATGHYARTATEEGTLRPLLLKGKPENDQSYLLSRLRPRQIERIRFPLGGYRKQEVRGLAKEMGLPVYAKPDSMEICFIPEGDYAAWLALRGPVPPEGDFVDSSGRVLGRHRGIHHYTLGQRRGLRFSAGRRMYVSKIDPKTNRITLSEGDGLLVREALCRAPNWISGDGLSFPAEGTVKFRHTRREEPAIFTPRGDLVHIALNAPVRMPAPGQLAVFYQGDQVMGSGWLI